MKLFWKFIFGLSNHWVSKLTFTGHYLLLLFCGWYGMMMLRDHVARWFWAVITVCWFVSLSLFLARFVFGPWYLLFVPPRALDPTQDTDVAMKYVDGEPQALSIRQQKREVEDEDL